MKRIATVALALLVTGAIARPVMAQSDVGAPLGSLYLSASNNSYEPIMQNLVVSQIYTIYLVADIDFADIGRPEQNASNGMTAWEASITAPPSMFILSRDRTPPESLRIGADDNDFIVALGSTLAASTFPRPLVTISFLLGGPVPAPGFEMVVAPARAAQTVPGEAVWLEAQTANGCTNTLSGAPEACIFPFAFLGNLTVSTDISAEESSWGELKKGY